MATQYAFGKIVTNGLILALDAADKNSYPGSGTVWRDLSINSYAGSLVNTPTFSSANGGSFAFNGTNQYTSTTYSQPAYGTGTSFTWNVWVNPGAGATSAPIVGNRGASLVFTKLTRNAFEYYPLVIPTVLTAGVWQNACIVKNGTNFTYYLNNISAAVSSSSATQTSVPFFIGGDNTAAEYFVGSVAITQVYDRALSASEISQNYNALKSRFGLI
jgi:hypothetical protein